MSFALVELLQNLDAAGVPGTAISQAFMALDLGSIPPDPNALLQMQIGRCVGRYFAASGFSL